VRVEGFSDVAVWGMRVQETGEEVVMEGRGGISAVSLADNPRKGRARAAAFLKSHLGLSAKAMANYLIKETKKKILPHKLQSN
jgi:predicted Zn-dependent protease